MHYLVFTICHKTMLVIQGEKLAGKTKRSWGERKNAKMFGENEMFFFSFLAVFLIDFVSEV